MITLTGAAMAVSLNPITVYADSQKGNADFDTYLTNEFVAMNEEDYTTMHYNVVNYSKYNIQKPDVNIGTIKTKDEVISENQKSLDALHEFDYNSLSDTQKEDYTEYEYELETAIAQAQYMDLEMLFEPNTDVTSNLITNMTEFVLRSKEDTDDYLTVLKTIPAYLDDAISITKDQSSKGIFLTNDQLNETEEWIDGFTEKTSDNALIAVFNDRVKAADFISDADKTTYMEQNQKIVLEQIIPAYQKVRTELEAMRGTRKYGDSVYDLPQGAAYYKEALRSSASSNKTPEELVDICTTYLQETIQKLALAQASQKSSTLNATVTLKTPEETLSYLQQQLSKEYPSLSSFTYHAEYLDESVATDSVVAYYVSCPVDDATQNSIKINKDNISDANTLYETLAHEGISGHMYQRNYYMSTNPNPLRLIINSLGYTEGWAMYSENEMWKYSGLSSEAADYNAMNTGFQYVLDAVTDIMVNGLGYSQAKVAKYYEQLGLSSSSVSQIIAYVEKYPNMLVPYGVGLAYFMELREEAEDALGSSFDATEYNTVLLNNGSRNFGLVTSDVEAYIQSKNGTVPEDSQLEETTEDEAQDSAGQQANWYLFGGIGAGLAALGIIALIAGRKYRKDDPFGA
jgi:uncharacterized protein (DUF885 family)